MMLGMAGGVALLRAPSRAGDLSVTFEPDPDRLAGRLSCAWRGLVLATLAGLCFELRPTRRRIRGLPPAFSPNHRGVPPNAPGDWTPDTSNGDGSLSPFPFEAP